jgi:hypothetical protein
LNKINPKSIQKIKETILITDIKEKAKIRFFEEISKIHQLSAIYGWQVIDHTNSGFLEMFKESFFKFTQRI